MGLDDHPTTLKGWEAWAKARDLRETNSYTLWDTWRPKEPAIGINAGMLRPFLDRKVWALDVHIDGVHRPAAALFTFGNHFGWVLKEPDRAKPWAGPYLQRVDGFEVGLCVPGAFGEPRWGLLGLAMVQGYSGLTPLVQEYHATLERALASAPPPGFQAMRHFSPMLRPKSAPPAEDPEQFCRDLRTLICGVSALGTVAEMGKI